MGIYRRRDSPTYWMSLQIDGIRVRMNTGVSERRLAEDIYAAFKVEQAKIRWLGIPPPDWDHTLQELIEEYLKNISPRKSPDSQRRDHGVLQKFSDRWGTLLLSDLTANVIEDYMAERLSTVCFATVSKEVGLLKAVFHCARRWDWMSQNPFNGIALNQEGEERIRWLTEEEEERLLAVCPDWLADMVVVGIDTGLRRTTLVRLRGEWLHEDASVVMIPRRRTKGKKAPITIPLTTRAVRIIRRHVDASTGEFVFVRRDGRPYHPDQVGARFRRVAHSAGIPDVSLHTLRHTFVSRLVQEGRPLTEVAALAGHRDIRMTARYAHLATEHLTNAVRALERRRRRYEARTRPRPSRRLP